MDLTVILKNFLDRSQDGHQYWLEVPQPELT